MIPIPIPITTPGRRLRRRLLLVAAVAFAGTLTLATVQAHADTDFWVEACSSSNATNWSWLDFDGSNVKYTTTNNNCDATNKGLNTFTGGATTPTTSGGFAGGWAVAAPAGASITQLYYTGGWFAATGGWGAGWFGATASDDGALAAENDPTDHPLSNTPQYDCLALNQSTYNAGSHTGNCANTSTHESDNVALTAPGGVGPLQEIGLGVECRSSSCSTSDSGTAEVSSADVLIDDPNTTPSTTGALNAGLDANWHQGSFWDGHSFTANASDPTGVCSLNAGLYNGAGQEVAAATASNPVAYDGATGDYTSTDPCGGGLGTTVTPNFGSLPSGVYYFNASSANVGGSTGWAYGNSPTDGLAVRVDNTTPSASFQDGPSQSSWNPTAQTVDIQPSDTDANGTGSGVQYISCANQQDTNKTATLTVDGNEDAVTIPQSMWVEGTSTVTCFAASNAGNQSANVSFTENVDTQTPSTSFTGAGTNAADVPSILDALPGANQDDQQDPSVSVSGSETNQESGISSETCTVDGNDPITLNSGQNLPTSQFQDGVNTVSCYSTTGAGLDDSAHPVTGTINVEATAPQITLGGATAYNASDPTTYNGGPTQVTVAAQEPDGTYPDDSVFGIQSVACSINGASPQIVVGDSGTFNVTGNGQNTVACFATNDAGVVSQTANEVVAIDSDAPSSDGGTITAGPSSPDGYTQTPQQITLGFTARGGAEMSDIRCDLGGTTTDYTPDSGSVTMSDAGDTESVSISVPPPGGPLTCQGEDSAGLWSGPASWTFNIDNTPPTGVFEPQDPSNPTLVQALLADDGSGVATTQIQIQEGGTWQNLTTTWNPKTGVASASIPDDGSIPDGIYPLQVIATDKAGNSTDTNGSNITLDTAGQEEQVRLPLRVLTHVIAALSAGTTQAPASQSTPDALTSGSLGSSALEQSLAKHGKGSAKKPKKGTDTKVKGGKTCTVRVKTTRKANKKKHTGKATKLVKKCVKTTTKSGHGPLMLSYGQKSTITGLLKTGAGVPIPNAKVQIEDIATPTPTGTVPKNIASATPSVIGNAVTNAEGQFSYTIPAGPSRTITAHYAGNDILRTSSSSQNIEVAGQSTISMPKRLVPGKKVTIAGKLAGGHVPATGAIVQLWYTTKGNQVSWAPFASAVHTNPGGAWKLTFPLSKKALGYTYEFKAVVSDQDDWAYLTTTSKVLTRKIPGHHATTRRGKQHRRGHKHH